MIDLRLGRWQDVLADVGEVDAVITDPPYSERTHSGHDGGARGRFDKALKTPLCYDAWCPDDWRHFLDWCAAKCRGWVVILTSHDLVATIEDRLRFQDRYVFAPLPFVAPGSRVRLQGDGPSYWSTWIVVARPRHEPFSKWGTLPGAYILPKGHSDRDQHIGGKPTWLMRALIRDYTKPGDLVCDPCAGMATTLIAADIEGRRSVGAEMDPDTYAKAKRRIEAGYTPSLFGGVS